LVSVCFVAVISWAQGLIITLSQDHIDLFDVEYVSDVANLSFIYFSVSRSLEEVSLRKVRDHPSVSSSEELRLFMKKRRKKRVWSL